MAQGLTPPPPIPPALTSGVSFANMKERPIIFSGPMVRAILDGRKTQTRRAVKPQPKDGLSWRGVISCSTVRADEGKHLFTDRYPCVGKSQHIRCPYGRPGDRLWVRETWHPSARFGTEYEIEYKADEATLVINAGARGVTRSIDEAIFKGWRPSIHMPRWASRIALEVVSVRVERLNEISEGDAESEGVERLANAPKFFHGYGKNGPNWHRTARESFQSAWKSINGHGSWAENPFVWVVEFRRV